MVGRFLWHINLSRLFNTKSISMQIELFQTIEFSMSTVCQNIPISSYSVFSNSSNSAKSKYIFCLHSVKCKNSSINNFV